jgi:hypothetical protein
MMGRGLLPCFPLCICQDRDLAPHGRGHGPSRRPVRETGPEPIIFRCLSHTRGTAWGAPSLGHLGRARVAGGCGFTRCHGHEDARQIDDRKPRARQACSHRQYLLARGRGNIVSGQAAFISGLGAGLATCSRNLFFEPCIDEDFDRDLAGFGNFGKLTHQVFINGN